MHISRRNLPFEVVTLLGSSFKYVCPSFAFASSSIRMRLSLAFEDMLSFLITDTFIGKSVNLVFQSGQLVDLNLHGTVMFHKKGIIP